ncbi:exocyst subunit SEC8 [Sporobolomyces koalae]|uniref:exocyst subunit SEC8 n=1 Tax=Sporobolomyces koalae TaxID=500713 RepID=UPI003182AECE
MSPSTKRYSGRPPTCPHSLDDPPPQLTEEQLNVPTSELYSVALEQLYQHRADNGSTELVANATTERERDETDEVEQFEPDPSRADRPTPRHYGLYSKERSLLDWTYHVVPTKARQALQDDIVNLVLGTQVKECQDAGDDECCRISGTGQAELGCQLGDCDHDVANEKPLALFTAGGMGAGKGHTLRNMLRTRRIRLPANTVWIDPDALSRLLPERPQYLAHAPETASSLLHPEASLLQEICAAVARERKRSLVIDGSLTDCAWFAGFMKTFKESGYECEILFVSAPEETMIKRAERRAKSTGRVTNPDAIKRSRQKSPECVSRLSKPSLVRRVRLIDNSDDSSGSDAKGSEILYDSSLDPVWPAPGHEPLERVRDADKAGWVDVKGFVDGRLLQGADGRVPPPRPGYPAVNGYPTSQPRLNTASPAFNSSSSDTSLMPAPPLRPERSIRRPVGATPSPATIGGNDSGRFEGGRLSPVPPHIGITGSDGRSGEGKNRRMMDQLNGISRYDDANVGPDSPTFSPNPASPSPNQFGRLSPNPSSRTYTRQGRNRGPADESDVESDVSTHSRPHSPSHDDSTDSPPLVVPSTLQDAISAFSNAGKRANGRRGGLADQGIQGGDQSRKNSTAPSRGQSIPSALDPEDYPDTPAFREVEEVLRKVATEWPTLARGTSVANDELGTEDFDPVSLALRLLDPASAREHDSNAGRQQSLSSFLRLKAELDHAIQSTLSPVTNPSKTTSDAYRAYETSITTHNMTLGALGAAQKQISGLKNGLTGTREMLEGRGREGLAGMYARMGMLEEMSSVLDEIDHLLRLPPSLEALLSEKRFLSAVVLLVRSIKTLNKPEMQDIGALADLRAWAQGQETVMLEILIEELHNHLYLKSFYCDVRWKSYTRGQTSLPLVDFGDDADVASSVPSHLSASFHSSGRSTARLPRMSKLQRFLQSLALKPSSNPMLDEAIEELMLVGEEAEDDASTLAIPGSFSFGSGETLGSLSAEGSIGGSGVGGAAAATRKTPRQRGGRNPEVDSFAYIEMLMEALAALGKLGYALDAVGQRVQGEMFALVESTVEEVEERNDPSRGMFGGSTTTGGGVGSATLRPSSTLVPSFPDFGASSSTATGAGSWATEGVASLLRLSASETSTLASSVETLRDLFWTLYSKLDAVLQGFRVAYEVAGRIAERRDFKDASIIRTSSGNLLFSLLDVWKPVQQEVRALLHDYLQDDESGTVSSRNPIVSVNEVLRFPKPRDATKQIFKFSESDLAKSSKALKTYEDSLNQALKAAVPGLITDGVPSVTTTSALIVASTDFSNGSRGSGLNGTHKALVPADAFNVSVLFGPTLSFLERVKEIMPGGLVNDEETNASTSFGGFLDEFVLRTFLPQLEDKVASVFHQAVGGIDAFQEDPNWKRVSKVPIVRSVSNLMLLIVSLTSMLRGTPFHRDNYSQLIVSVIHQFYQRCLERFRDLVSREPQENHTSANGSSATLNAHAPLKTAAEWAGTDELYSVLSELQETPGTDSARIRELLSKETKIELDRKRNGIIDAEDLITPSKKLLAIATLYSSLDWFINRIATLNTGHDHAPSTTPFRPEGFAGRARRTRESSESTNDGTSTAASRGGDDVEDDDREPNGKGSPLTGDMARPFEALLKGYSRLSSTILYTLRLEIRLRTMHYLDKATRDGVYQLAEDVQEPDPSVVDLNGDLAEVDEVAAGTLGLEERSFVFAGLSLLMDHLLITNARQIRLANSYGLSKMNRNILALQQNLKNIGNEPLEVEFDRSRKFWDLFGKGPRAMLDEIQDGNLTYSFDDYKTLLQLQLQIDQSGKDTAVPSTSGGITDSMIGAPANISNDKNRRAYGEYMIELFSLDNGNDGDD